MVIAVDNVRVLQVDLIRVIGTAAKRKRDWLLGCQQLLESSLAPFPDFFAAQNVIRSRAQ